MTHNDLTFFTNEPERDLCSRFNKILDNNTEFFDVLVGYFRTSGFFKLYNSMGKIEKIRILVGLNVNAQTVQIINKANAELKIENVSFKESKELLSSAIEKEFNTCEDSYSVEKGVCAFIEWLKSGKIEMRMYIEAPIHAKVYIIRKDMEKDAEHYGSVITGSSNFSEAGLINNLEFNVELKDSRDVAFALERFEALWLKSVDIKETYIETVNDKTWLKGDITPYELYLKTIYEYFSEEINADKEAMLDELLPEGFMRLQYQLDAVVEAEKKLEAYNGVFISDVVGLGKTYICAMLAKKLKKGKKLVICPPVLVDYWNKVLLEFDVSATVESLGKLDKLIHKGVDDYKYVFIDEAHRFRNQDTESFALLHEICYNKKVILISATPINNYSSDIENQIYLFQPKHNSLFPNVKNLEGFFAKLNSSLNKLEKGTPEYNLQLKVNSESIRDNILRSVMIRRTRKEIVEFYAEDMKRQGLTFPKLETPKKIVYTFDANTDVVFKETMHLIKTLDYARYTPLLFLKDNKKYAKMLTSQHNMSGFMKSILVKRLESSFFAFKMTLGRFIQSYEQFIKMYDTGELYVSKKVNVYDLLDNGDDDKLMGFVDSDRVQHFSADEFTPLFRISLERDLGMLKQLKAHWAEVTLDPKFEEFKKDLLTNKILKSKMIVFTESKETAHYLGDNLKVTYGDRLVVFSGESSNYLKTEIEQSFNPAYKEMNNDKYDILITTDVLAEGINLHRANVVINYDLPWNPTKIMQRVGRINRVGTEHERIFVFNFFPTSQTDKQLPIKDRIIEKLQAFHDTLGEDFKYLSEDERVGPQKLFDDLTSDLEEDEGTNLELAYLAVIRQVRDNDIALFKKIKHLPLKAKTGKLSGKISSEATITFIRKGYLKMFLKTEQAETKELNFLNAISYIKSEKEDKAELVGKSYYNHLDNNKLAFDERLKEGDAVVISGVPIKGNDAKMLKRLKWISNCDGFTEKQDSNITRMFALWENGEIPSIITKRILKDIEKIEEPMQAYFEILDRIPDRYFLTSNQCKKEDAGEKQVVLSCFLRNGEAK